MTREQFLQACRRVALYSNLVVGLAGGTAIFLNAILLIWVGPFVGAFGRLVRNSVPNESIAGLIFGLTIGSVLVLELLVVILGPALWVNRRIGLRCPRCERSITLGRGKCSVLRLGKCYKCQTQLFEALENEAPLDAAQFADREYYGDSNPRRTRRFFAVACGVGLLVTYAIILPLKGNGMMPDHITWSMVVVYPLTLIGLLMWFGWAPVFFPKRPLVGIMLGLVLAYAAVVLAGLE